MIIEGDYIDMRILVIKKNNILISNNANEIAGFINNKFNEKKLAIIKMYSQLIIILKKKLDNKWTYII